MRQKAARHPPAPKVRRQRRDELRQCKISPPCLRKSMSYFSKGMSLPLSVRKRHGVAFGPSPSVFGLLGALQMRFMRVLGFAAAVLAATMAMAMAQTKKPTQDE